MISKLFWSSIFTLNFTAVRMTCSHPNSILHSHCIEGDIITAVKSLWHIFIFCEFMGRLLTLLPLLGHLINFDPVCRVSNNLQSIQITVPDLCGINISLPAITKSKEGKCFAGWEWEKTARSHTKEKGKDKNGALTWRRPHGSTDYMVLSRTCLKVCILFWLIW